MQCISEPQKINDQQIQSLEGLAIEKCASSFGVGEGCRMDCECLEPGTCIEGICSVKGLSDGELCHSNKQCLRGYCTESGRCGGPSAPIGV